MCSGLIIFPFNLIMSRVMPDSMLMASIYRTVPWIGGIAAHFDRTGRHKIIIGLGFAGIIFIFYFMYAGCYYLWTPMLFNRSYPNGINDAFFFGINMIEFMTFLLIRTRISIKYFPKFIFLTNIFFLGYIKHY